MRIKSRSNTNSQSGLKSSIAADFDFSVETSAESGTFFIRFLTIVVVMVLVLTVVVMKSVDVFKIFKWVDVDVVWLKLVVGDGLINFFNNNKI